MLSIPMSATYGAGLVIGSKFYCFVFTVYSFTNFSKGKGGTIPGAAVPGRGGGLGSKIF